MGNFKQDYELQFGPLDYDPLKPKKLEDTAKRRALDFQGMAPTASPAQRRMALPLPEFSGPAEEEQGAISGLLKTGTSMLGEAGLGAVEYAADKLGLEHTSDVVQSGRESLAQWRQSIYDRMNPEVIDMKGREFLTLDPDKTIWKGSPLEVGESLMYKLVEQVPMTVATLVPGGLMMRAGSKGALTYLGASEAGLSVGFIQNEIKDGIAEMSDEELMSESPRFAALVQQYGAEEGRNKFEAEATGLAPIIGGMVVGAVGYTAGRYLEPVITGAGSYGAAQRFGRGFVGEGLFQEAPQESIEQLASNAARAAYDGDLQLLDGVAEAAVQGLAVGGPMGGAFGVAAGRKALPVAPEDDVTATVEDDVPTPPEEGGPGDVTFPETDLLGDQITSVPREATRDPLAQWDDPLTLQEELQAIDVRSPRERDLDRMSDARYDQIMGKAKSKRTKEEKAYLAKMDRKRQYQADLEVRYGVDPAIEAAMGAAVGRMHRENALPNRQEVDRSRGVGYTPDMLEQDAREQMQLGAESVQGIQPSVAPQPDPSRDFPKMGGQMEIPGLPPAERDQRELTGYTTRGGTDRLLVEPREQQRAWTDEQQLPTELDQPTPEPLGDLQAQLTAMDRGERDGVYLSAATLERYPRLLDDSPATVENFDGEGGAVVFPDIDTAAAYIDRRDSGEDMQVLLGEITGAGEGKPLSAEAVTLQMLDEQGNVVRESLLENEAQVEATQRQWSQEYDEAPRTTVRVTPFLETTDAPLAETEKVYGDFPEELNYIEQVDQNGEVIARVLAQGEEATAAKVAEFTEVIEQKPRSFRTLSPAETLMRRDRGSRPTQQFEVTDEAEFLSRQLDLFDPVPEVISQARDPKVTKVGPRVRVMDGNIVLWEKIFRAGFEKEAEQTVKALEEEIGGIEGISIWQDKSTKKEKKSYTPVMQRGARVATRAKARESYKRVDKSVAEQVQEKLGDKLSAAELKEVTDGATDLNEVADRLIEKGKQAEEVDRRNRVAGLFNPDKLTFKNPEVETKYRALWDTAVDAQTRLELKKLLGGTDTARVMGNAKNALKNVQERATKLRKAYGKDAWKKAPSKYLKQAREVSPKQTRKVIERARKAAEPQQTREEMDVTEVLAATRETQAQREVDIREEAYGDTPYDAAAVSASIDSLREINESMDEAANTPAELEALSEQLYFDSKMTAGYVKRLLNEGILSDDELVLLYEQAMLYRAAKNKGKGRSQPIQDLEITEQIEAARRGEIYQSDMIKDIERAAQQARTQEEKYAAGRSPSLLLPTERSRSRTGKSTAALTAPEYKAESAAGKRKRIERHTELSESIRKNADKTIKRVTDFDVDSIDIDGKTLPTSTGVKQLLALDYLKQLASFADVLAATGQKDAGTVKLMEQIDVALKRAATFEADQLATFWWKIAHDQNNLAAKVKEQARQREKEVKTLPGTTQKIGGTFATANIAELHRAEVLAESTVPLRAEVDGKTVRFYRQKKAIDEQNQAEYLENLDNWNKNEDFQTFVFPLIQKVIAAQYSAEGFYAFTKEETEILNWMLQKWDLGTDTKKQFSTPLRKFLRNVAMVPFEKNGQISQTWRLDGRLEHNLPESFDQRDRHYRTEKEITSKMKQPKERKPSDKGELRQPTKDLFGNPVPWNKKVPYQSGQTLYRAGPYIDRKNPKTGKMERVFDKYAGTPFSEEYVVEDPYALQPDPEPVETRGRKSQGPLFSKGNQQRVYDNNRRELARQAPEDIQLLQVFRKFRKVVDSSKSTRDALITAEEKLLLTMKELAMAKFANFKGLVYIQLPNGQKITYRRTASDLGNGVITKEVARKRMRAITKRMTMGTAAQNRWLAENKTADWTGTNLSMFDDSYTYTYQLENYDSAGPVTRETKEAASRMGDLLLNRREPPQVNELLDIIGGTAQGPFAIAARKLQKTWLKGVKVKWRSADADNLGQYDPATRTIWLNENVLMDMRGNFDFSVDAKAVHTVLHEAAHAATLHALRTRPGVRRSVDVLRQLMAGKWSAKAFAQRFEWATADDWVRASYGLKNAEEFVAEMYSNRMFQRMAAETQVSEMDKFSPIQVDFETGRKLSVLEGFKSLVRSIFGFDTPAEANVFDMVMAMSDELFSGAGRTVSGPSVNLKDLTAKAFDTWAGKAAAQGWDRLDSSMNIEQRVRDGILQRGDSGKWVDKLTSMAQLARRFGERLPGLAKYVEAFRQRNARNAQLMEVPEKISREWTTLQENSPEMALELSKVMTESSLYGIDPTQSLSHPRNNQVKSPEQNRRYYDLTPRYRALSPEAKAIWKKTSEYYQSALKRETGYLMLNALRGTVSMDEAAFDKKYNHENILKFDTKQKLREEFGETLEDVNLGTILRLANLPELKSGVYFPLTRYGDYAVEAQKEIKSKTFTSKEEANKWRDSYKAKDPTYRVEIYRDKGRWKGKVMEREFSLFESASQARERKRELEDIYGVGNVTLTHKYEKQAEAAIASNKELQSVLTALQNNPAAQAAIKNFYLRGLADTSFRKREINRKQVRGVDAASQHRNFANYAKQASYYTAQLQYGYQLADAITEMEKATRSIYDEKEALRLGQVLKSVRERDEMSQDLVFINPAIRKLLGATQFFMLTSASYHMINSTQPWMVTLPIMSSKHGAGKTFAAMRAAQKVVMGTVGKEMKDSLFGVKALTSRAAAEKAFGVFEQLKENIKDHPKSAEYIAMLEELRQRHILEVSPMTELREVAAGADTSVGARALDASRIMAHLVEVNNRVLTSVAAYDLAYAEARGEGLGHAAAMQRGRDYAAEMVETTQFDYSTANKPPLFQKIPFMFQFMQWTQHIYALMIQNTYNSVKGGTAQERQEARKALMGLFGTHAMVGGVLGVTLQPVKMALGLVALLFADEDDPIDAASAISGEWYDRMVTDGLASVLGSDLAMIASRGLPMALGTDLSTRMSLGTLYFVDLRQEDPQQVVGSLVMSFGGAPLSQSMAWAQGAAKILDGDWVRGIEQMSPKLFRDMIRTGRYASEGLVNRAGDTVIRTEDMSPIQLALQFLGFAPEQVSRFYAGQQAQKSVENFVRKRKAELLREYRTATDANERMRVRKEIREFNRRYRLDAIKGSSVSSTMKSKYERERAYDRYGASIDPKKARQYSQYGEPYR